MTKIFSWLYIYNINYISLFSFISIFELACALFFITFISNSQSFAYGLSPKVYSAQVIRLKSDET